MAEPTVLRCLWFIPVLVGLVSCGGSIEKPAPAVPQKMTVVPGLVGQWEVVSYGRKPLPSGVAITVNYQADGVVALDITGDSPSVPTIDRAMLKKLMDDFGKEWGDRGPKTMTFESSDPKSSEVFAVELRRK